MVSSNARSVVRISWADGEAEYKYREGIMKSAGGHMSSMVAILRGRVHFDNLAIHARGMADVAGIMPTVFPEGSRVSDTEAPKRFGLIEKASMQQWINSLLRPIRWLSPQNRATWVKWGRQCKRWVKAAKGVTTTTGSPING